MSKVNLPQREKRARMAKEKASVEITNYFRPKRLYNIQEDDELTFQNNKMKDENNNNQPKTSGQTKQKRTVRREKQIALQKITATVLTPTVSSPAEKSKTSMDRPETPSDHTMALIDSNDDIIVLDTSMESDNGEQSKMDFDNLHTDDATETEDSTKNAPYWSLRRNRQAIVKDQFETDSNIIDTFFDCKAETISLNQIFSNYCSKPRRRSTAVWDTPPRYSMLPKY